MFFNGENALAEEHEHSVRSPVFCDFPSSPSMKNTFRVLSLSLASVFALTGTALAEESMMPEDGTSDPMMMDEYMPVEESAPMQSMRRSTMRKMRDDCSKMTRYGDGMKAVKECKKQAVLRRNANQKKALDLRTEAQIIRREVRGAESPDFAAERKARLKNESNSDFMKLNQNLRNYFRPHPSPFERSERLKNRRELYQSQRQEPGNLRDRTRSLEMELQNAEPADGE